VNGNTGLGAIGLTAPNHLAIASHAIPCWSTDDGSATSDVAMSSPSAAPERLPPLLNMWRTPPQGSSLASGLDTKRLYCTVSSSQRMRVGTAADSTSKNCLLDPGVDAPTPPGQKSLRFCPCRLGPRKPGFGFPKHGNLDVGLAGTALPLVVLHCLLPCRWCARVLCLQSNHGADCVTSTASR